MLVLAGPAMRPYSTFMRLATSCSGIPLHGCLKTRTCYDEAIASGSQGNIPESDAAA